MIPKLYLAGGLAIILLSLTTWGLWERNSKLSIKAEYDGFISKAQILAAERLAENQRKEAEYNERIKKAESARTAAVKRLRDQNHSGIPRLPFLPASTEARICFDRPKLDAAIGILVKDLQGIATDGDLALIDLQTFVESWPR